MVFFTPTSCFIRGRREYSTISWKGTKTISHIGFESRPGVIGRTSVGLPVGNHLISDTGNIPHGNIPVRPTRELAEDAENYQPLKELGRCKKIRRIKGCCSIIVEKKGARILMRLPVCVVTNFNMQPQEYLKNFKGFFVAIVRIGSVFGWEIPLILSSKIIYVESILTLHEFTIVNFNR